MRFLPRLHLVAAMLGLFLSWPVVGRSEEESKKVCASAFVDAQRSIRSGHLRAAKDNLVLCGSPRCPQVMHSECQRLLFTVETSIPTVVFKVTLQGPSPSEANSSSDVSIAVDGGEPVPFDDRAMALDPGAHDFTFTASGFRAVSKHIVVGEGEMLRREQVILSASLVSPRAEEPKLLAFAPSESVRVSAPRKKSLIVPLIISSSMAALASASAVYFGIQARSDDHALDSCAPTATCSVNAADRVRREYLWTNVSIGAAVAGLATSTVLFLLNNKEPKKANRTVLGFAQRRNRLGAGDL